MKWQFICWPKHPWPATCGSSWSQPRFLKNLERVGDEASKISNRARDLAQEAPLKLTLDIPRMSNLGSQMLKGALDAFVNQDPVAARALIPRDKEVDALNKQIYRDL